MSGLVLAATQKIFSLAAIVVVVVVVIVIFCCELSSLFEPLMSTKGRSRLIVLKKRLSAIEGLRVARNLFAKQPTRC